MSAEREIRLTEIPTELRNLRAEIDRHAGNWARELTRAEGLERQLKAAIDARDAARKTCDDLTDHCASQGRRIADLDRQLGESFEIKLLQSDEIARLRASGADAARGADITARLRAYSSFLKSIWDVCYAQRAACLDDVRDAISEVLTNDHLFTDCDVCGGRLWDEDIEECPHCVAGREPR